MGNALAQSGCSVSLISLVRSDLSKAIKDRITACPKVCRIKNKKNFDGVDARSIFFVQSRSIRRQSQLAPLAHPDGSAALCARL